MWRAGATGDVPLRAGLAVLLAIGVALAVVAGGGGGGVLPGGTTEVTAVIGSEKRPFFDDERTVAAFAEHGLAVRIDTAGSRQIATEALEAADYDLAFPSSVPAAEKIRRDQDVTASSSPFYSPVVVATFEPIAQLLEAAGVASQDAAGVWRFDMDAYLETVAAGTRWNELPGNNGAAAPYPSSRSILLTSTDVRRSNSAAMYLAIASYAANEDAVVVTPEQEAAVLPVLSELFLGQGFSDASSEGPFADYVSLGIGKAPMIVAYESQFLERQIAGDGSITDDMLYMYPSPTVLSEHTVVPLTEAGAEVGRLLETDPVLVALLAEYGFRVPDRQVFADVLAESGVEVPPDVVDTVDTPSYEVLERLIVALEQQYDSAGAPAPPTAEVSADPDT